MAEQDINGASLMNNNRPEQLVVNVNGARVDFMINQYEIGGVESGTTSTAHNVEQSVESPQEENIRKLCNVVNRQTLEEVTVKLTEDFRDENLVEPDFQVHPQMRRVKDFFYDVLRHQFRGDVGFFFERTQDTNEPITSDELARSVTKQRNFNPQDRNPVTALVASTGSGKTTQLRRLTKETLDSCPIFDYEGKPEVQQSHLKMVYYAEMKHMENETMLKPSQLLFGGRYENESDEHEAYRWLLNHQSEAILYFDGLDQATWIIDDLSQRKIKPFQIGSTSQIMYNLLSRNLLPHVKIVFTSREFKVSELPAKARPGEIISLAGLTKANAEKLFVALIKDHGADIWSRIGALSPRFLNLVSVPVLLVLTAAVMVRDSNTPPPTTITDLYNRILLSLRCVENIQQRKQILEIIKKLKGMAHQGMLEGRVIFHESDLKNFGLSIEDILDLMTKIPGSLGRRHLDEGISLFFFCHQSLQEFLSASFIAETGGEQFSQFNYEHLHKSRWSDVRTFVSGIIHQGSVSELHKVSDQENKQKLFCETVKSRITKERNAAGLLAAIYESDNYDLIRSLPSLPSVSRTKLGRDEVHMFSSIWARRGNVEKEDQVDLSKCGLGDELLSIMEQNLKDRETRVGYLDLSVNSFTANGLKPFLAKLKADAMSIDYELLKDFRYEDFDWKNIRKVDWHYGLKMINGKETITIKGDVNGCFDKAPRASETDQRLSLHDMALKSGAFDMVRFFKAQLIFEDQVYVEPLYLSELAAPDIRGKISKMLLDCRPNTKVDSSLSEVVVDSSLIDSCVRKFQVDFLNILVNDKTSFTTSNFQTEIESDIIVKVHWWFEVGNSDAFANIIPIVQNNQVEILWLRIGCRSATFDHIKTVIKECKCTEKCKSGLKKLIMVYQTEQEKLRMKHEEIAKFAERHSIEVESVIWQREDDSWKMAYYVEI